MTDAPAIRSFAARLISEPPLDPERPRPGRRLYRPLVVGPVLLERCGPRFPWLVRVSPGGMLVPPASAGLERRVRRLQSAGVIHRLAAALVSPQDFAGPPRRILVHGRRPTAEFYGWALMYQLPGMRTVAAIDPHERFPDLPAFFESPVELIDRSEFLAARGIPSRAVALITQPADFVATDRGRPGNRFYPGQTFHRPVDFGWFS